MTVWHRKMIGMFTSRKRLQNRCIKLVTQFDKESFTSSYMPYNSLRFNKKKLIFWTETPRAKCGIIFRHMNLLITNVTLGHILINEQYKK